MSLKKIKIIHIDQFTTMCGFFNSDTLEVNNGYNCNHPDCEETQIIGDKEIGKCYSFSCPLAPEVDHQDLKEHDKDLYNDYKNDSEVNDYVVVNMEDFPKDA
ncbi:MAG: hypothetical protein E3J23_08525 [Candidatus Stahlbacteria bacterium]|nr:MAG: hypothetical protein E3J23_08525 [Candidatus Stahlbacteria bacterium]